MIKIFEEIPVIKLKTRNEDSFIRVMELAFKNGLKPADIFMPYPVDIPENKLLQKKKRPGTIAFLSGLAGLVVAIIFLPYYQLGYPLNFGTKPDLPLLAFVPPAFVLVILFAAIATFIYFMVSEHLIPGQQPKIYCLESTSDHFCILFRKKDIPDLSEHYFREIDHLEISEDVYFRQTISLPIPLKINKI